LAELKGIASTIPNQSILINTLGILEILYIFLFSKIKTNNKIKHKKNKNNKAIVFSYI
jgi:hypothetical protein